MKINNIHIVFLITILSDKHIKFILCFYYCMKTLRRPKGKIRSCNSKDRQYNDQREKYKKRNNYPQNTTHKTTD